MISFFPTPYPDELWYSVICRYHVHSGNSCAKHTMRQLYGDGTYTASMMLCGHIVPLLAQLPRGYLSIKDVILRHTLYPYYARFYSTQRKRSTYAYAFNGSGNAVHRMGISQASGNHYTVLRYCPVCHQEDFAQYGEPYWHRSHQLPDMQLCVKHRCWLVDTDAVCVHNRQGELFPATFTMHLAQPSTAPIPDSLFALHRLLQDTIDAPFDFKDGTVYYDVIDRALLSRGWRSPTGGHTYAAKVGSALLNLYGTSIPAGDISATQLHATLSRKCVAPRYILQLAVLFELSLSELLTPPRSPAPNFKKEMQEMYHAGVSMYHIAQLYATDAKTVARWVK